MPEKWRARLDHFSSSRLIGDFRALPLFEVDFAQWLRKHTDCPHDAAHRVWPTREIPDYLSRDMVMRSKRIADAITQIAVSDSDRKLIDAIENNA